MQSIERWNPVPGYEGLYSVSTSGNVRRDTTGRILKAASNRGYLKVTLSRGGTLKTFRVHTLVLLAHVGERPPGLEGCHTNGDRSDNSLANLRWDTHRANIADQKRHFTHWNARKTRCLRGHPFDELNTYRAKDGSRDCRACRRSMKRAARSAA